MQNMLNSLKPALIIVPLIAWALTMLSLSGCTPESDSYTPDKITITTLDGNTIVHSNSDTFFDCYFYNNNIYKTQAFICDERLTPSKEHSLTNSK